MASTTALKGQALFDLSGKVALVTGSSLLTYSSKRSISDSSQEEALELV